MASRKIMINGVLRTDPRQTRAWRVLRDQVVGDEPTCRLRIPGICTTVSTTADHIRTVEEAPELALKRDNLRGACEPCNRARHTLPDEALNHDPPSPALEVFG